MSNALVVPSYVTFTYQDSKGASSSRTTRQWNIRFDRQGRVYYHAYDVARQQYRNFKAIGVSNVAING